MKITGLSAEGERIIVRDGRKIRLFYHERCFSGTADPRTQQHSSYHEGKFTNINPEAPRVKGQGKWSVSSYGYQAAPPHT
ncbi:hypothetical protein PAPYR_3437 [Paratrimastix pyriformis]|uniref:Uncharacterized protein n=1 Tax=Paratrimastix pyriformis TaxID=342808 RepID=A0ABQ8UMK1_9EUKA|nr:hypothetical protein PAPYR_3437 [Paratrimastix pyriformis]